MIQSKEIGGYAEARFTVEALSRGYAVCKPFIDSRKYDFIIEKHGRFVRVQVKATSKISSEAKDGSFYIRIGYGSDKNQSYTKKDIDIVACYIAPLKIFYLIPIEFLGQAKRITLHPLDESSKFNPFRENWTF